MSGEIFNTDVSTPVVARHDSGLGLFSLFDTQVKVEAWQDGKSITVSASYFIDGTYEGDLMAKSGITYHVGREDNSVYGETWNGVQLLDRHQFPDGIDPYVEKGNPESGLLWGISDAVVAENGTGEYLKYNLPSLQGVWDIYCYQQLRDKSNPLVNYEITVGDLVTGKVLDKSKLALVGQVSGEWIHMGSYDFKDGLGGAVKLWADDCGLPLRADALMLLRRCS